MNNKDIHEALIPISKEFFDLYLILGVRIDNGQKILLGDLGVNEDVRNQIVPVHKHLRDKWLDGATGVKGKQLD